MTEMTSNLEPAETELLAAERAVRAVMWIAVRHGCVLTRVAAEQIRDAVLGCADTDVHADYLLPDDVYDSMRDAGEQ